MLKIPEMKLRNDTRIGGDTDDDVLQQRLVLDQDPERNLENTISLNNRIHEYFHDDNIRTEEPLVWMKGDIVAGPHQFPEGDFTKYANFPCCGMFELFFDNELINYLIEESQRYAQFINQQDPKISQAELRCFLGIMFLSGYNEVPSKRMYWDIKDEVKNQMVDNAMRRNRFLQKQRFLHCADNSKVWEEILLENTTCYGAIGTMRENLVPNSCTLMDKNHFSKQARGHMEYLLERNSGVLLVRWMDNAVVTMASTSDGAHPIGTVKGEKSHRSTLRDMQILRELLADKVLSDKF
ncbi:hypothetical protein JTB14_000584 [Gonioctena quinquepunctata]|nr:hypothetical protein JTB14_000584 [Gonioctena quinquepunctata]